METSRWRGRLVEAILIAILLERAFKFFPSRPWFEFRSSVAGPTRDPQSISDNPVGSERAPFPLFHRVVLLPHSTEMCGMPGEPPVTFHSTGCSVPPLLY